MHKSILKMFSFIKNAVYFGKVLSMFFLMLNLLLWIQDITGSMFGWLQIFVPILSFFVNMGEMISDGSVNLFGAVFEFKYMIAVIIYVILYYIFNFILITLDNLEDKYDDLHRYVKKSGENSLNRSMHNEQKNEEEKINNYKILVSTELKKKFSHPELGYNLDEQNRIMNKFLTEKTGVFPEFYNNCFVYSFHNFNNVDDILHTFFKLIKSNSPLDYTICLQVVEGDEGICFEELKQLLSLKHVNKISTLANSVYRYKFNQGHRYGTSQLGLFQKGDTMVEVHEFIEI